MKSEKTELVQPLRVGFSKVSVQIKFEGEPEIWDLREIVGNKIRAGTGDIGLDELAKTIYFSEGEVEIPKLYIEPIVSIINQSTLIVPLKQAISQLLTNNKED